MSQAKDAIANLTADNVTHIGRVQFLEQKFSVALKEREQVLPVVCAVELQPLAACDAREQARSDLAKSDEQWFAQLRLEVERVTRAHMQVHFSNHLSRVICHPAAGDGSMRTPPARRAHRSRRRPRRASSGHGGGKRAQCGAAEGSATAAGEFCIGFSVQFGKM
jgi:hypothetical protein